MRGFRIQGRRCSLARVHKAGAALLISSFAGYVTCNTIVHAHAEMQHEVTCNHHEPDT